YFSYVSCNTASGTCSENPTGTLTWNLGTLTAGSSSTLTYQMLAASSGIPSGLSELNNTASVADDAYYTGGTPPANCSSETVSVSVSGNPKLALVLTANNVAVLPSDLVIYTLQVTNNGSSTANDLLIANPIPSATGFVEITSGTGSFDTLNNQVLFPLASLAAAASANYSFTVQVNNPLTSGSTTITSTATVSAANAKASSDSVTITATAAPIMSISLSGPGNIPLPATTLAANANTSNTLIMTSAALLSPGDYILVNSSYARITSIAGDLVTVDTPITATSGDSIQLAASYSILYQNTGNAAATNVLINETLPAGWGYIASSPTATSAPSVGSNGTINWVIGTVEAGNSGAMQFVALPTSSGSFTHTATLTADGSITETATTTALVGGLTG
ncbi:MAG: DUF11 domain-containing protein, partial [Pseudomonadales bacterium]|nr:DUF11 domain-containing protein [Pseudomonadales bacterium]